MGVLKEKANHSFKSAGLLIDEKQFNPSVHCSYYSCIQLVLDIIFEKLNVSESKLETDARAYMAQQRTGHHLYYITRIRDELSSKQVPPAIINNVYNDLSQLKAKREMADYTRIHCIKLEAEMAKEKAKVVRNSLEKIFK